MRNSLWTLLILGLAGLQFVAILVVVFSSYVTSERALLSHARELLADIGTNASEHSRGFLNPAQGAAELAARLAENRVIASDDPVLLERLLFQQLQIAPQFHGLYFGKEDGGFVQVMRSVDGLAPLRTKITKIENGIRTTELIWRNHDFTVVERRFDPDDSYDPRTRPWYLRADAQRTTIWTDPYIFFSSQQPGISLAAPVLDGDNGIKGVVGVDIEISEISDFLSRLRIGDNGKALIVHESGDVIAYPNRDLIKTRNDDGSLRFTNISEFDDPIVRRAFSPFSDDRGIQVSQETAAQFTLDGASYVSIIMPSISEKLPWTIAVYAPENDFTADIKHNRTVNIWIAAAISLVTAVIGLALADYIHKPVKAFAIRSSLIAQGEIDPTEPLPPTYKELEKANDELVRQIVARRQAEREYGQTFDLSPRGMARVSPETGVLLRANTKFCEITGYRQDELIGRHLSELCEFDDLPHLLRNGPAAECDLPIHHERRCHRKDGRQIWVSINAIIIRDQNGHALHTALTMDDITEAKDKEDQIHQLNRELSHLARGNMMGELAAGLAHELNQPLTALAQNADAALMTVAEQPGADPELREILQEIERQSLRAGDIIRALRGFIRRDEGNRTSFDFTELLEQARHLVHAEMTEAGITTDIDLSPLPPVAGNRVQVAQVIVNLLRNAIEALASDDGTQDPRILISARHEGDHVRISVQDNGPGVDSSIKVFSQFETTKADGMGLGLSICRSIVETNGGRLWHETSPGRGATFHFTLPTDLV